MASKYIIMDSQSIPLARALLENAPTSKLWELEILDGAFEAAMEHEMLQLVSMDSSFPGAVGRIVRGRGDRIALEPLEKLGEEIRQNLRVMAHFSTYIYPLSASWTGRIPVMVHDLSSGGIAFFCVRELRRGDQVEIVLPIVSPPLILRAQVIRPRPSTSKTPLYAAKFVDLIEDEERLIREAVFGQQIKNSNKTSGEKERNEMAEEVASLDHSAGRKS